MVTTEKDAVRLPPGAAADPRLRVRHGPEDGGQGLRAQGAEDQDDEVVKLVEQRRREVERVCSRLPGWCL